MSGRRSSSCDGTPGGMAGTSYDAAAARTSTRFRRPALQSHAGAARAMRRCRCPACASPRAACRPAQPPTRRSHRPRAAASAASVRPRTRARCRRAAASACRASAARNSRSRSAVTDSFTACRSARSRRRSPARPPPHRARARIRRPARGHAGLIVGRGLAGQRRAEPVLRHACAALRDARGDRRQEPRMLVVDHRAGLLQIGERFLHRLVRYVDARFERVQLGIAEHRPPRARAASAGIATCQPACAAGAVEGRCARVVRRYGDRGR